MARNLAIAIGVNTYEHLDGSGLAYAERDAQAIGQYLRSGLGFESVFLFTETSPAVHGMLGPCHQRS